uniref:C-type lectin domain-containing protein n=1 Tax=Ciona intestinalis TaxID=7719 RepID=F6RAF6_CIOIN
MAQTGIKEINGRPWLSVGNGYLYRTIPARNYHAANTTCRAIGGRLAVVAPRNEHTMRTITTHPLIRTVSSHNWIGLNDIEQENTWVWENGERLLSRDAHWNSGEPTNSEGREDCVVAFSTGGWNDVPCDINATPLCEMSIFDT